MASVNARIWVTSKLHLPAGGTSWQEGCQHSFAEGSIMSRSDIEPVVPYEGRQCGPGGSTADVQNLGAAVEGNRCGNGSSGMSCQIVR